MKTAKTVRLPKARKLRSDITIPKNATPMFREMLQIDRENYLILEKIEWVRGVSFPGRSSAFGVGYVDGKLVKVELRTSHKPTVVELSLSQSAKTMRDVLLIEATVESNIEQSDEGLERWLRIIENELP
jgi:hypothetical protein